MFEPIEYLKEDGLFLLPHTSKSIKENDKTFYLHTIELENAILSFFFEEKERLGTLAIATPKNLESPGSSSIMLGYKNVTITRLLAELLAANSNKIAITFVFINTESDFSTNKILFKLAQSKHGCNS